MAQSSTGSLNARLTLTGSDEVKRQLEDVGAVGERSLGGLHGAGIHASEGLQGVEHTAERLASSFAGLGNLGSLGNLAGMFEGIAGGVGHFNIVLGAGLAIITGAAAGLFELAERGARFAAEIKDGATRVGVAAQDYATLRFAFEQSAASAEDFEKAMGKILEAAGVADDGAQKVEVAAEKIVNSEDRIKAAAEATADAYRKRADTLKEMAHKAADDISEINLRFERTRKANADLFGQRLLDAEKKNNDDRAEAMRLLNKRLVEERRLADKALAEEQDKQRRENLKATQKDLDDYNKALADAANKAFLGAKNKFTDFGIALKDGADKARDPAAVFRDIAEKIAEIEDPASRSAKAVELFGRRIGTKLVESLAAGRHGLRELEAEAKALNLVPTQAELGIGKKFDDEIAKLGSVVTAAAGRVGLVFAPLFGSIVDALAQALGHAIPTLIAWAQSVATIMKPAFDDLVLAIEGKTDEIKSQFIFVLARAFGVFVEAVKAAAIVIGALITGLVAAFTWLDGIVQSLFGGASLGGIAGFILALQAVLPLVSLVDIAISALITGPLAMLATALGYIVSGLIAIAAVIGWPAVLIIGVVAAIAALLTFGDNWTNVKNNLSAGWELMKAFGNWLVTGLAAAFTYIGDFAKGIWDRITYWAQYAVGVISQAWDWLLGKIKAVGDAIGKVLGMSSGGTVADVAARLPTAAGGGLARGPGSGTSDSILAKISDGEFIVKARAVKHWGLGVLHALNNMVSPGGFAAGGVVDALGGAMNRGATGAAFGLGLYEAAAGVEGRVSVDLSHEGTTFHNLLAPAAVAASLVRYAGSQQRVSLGRRSSAYGGSHV